MATSPGKVKKPRGRPPRIHKVAEDLKLITEQNKFNVGNMEDGVESPTDFLGTEEQRWNMLKSSEELTSDNDVVKLLLDFWEEKQTEMNLAEIKRPACDLNIAVNYDTLGKFHTYKFKYNRTNDEIIKFFCQLDLEPGENAIGVDIETMKTFMLLKIRMNLSSVQALNYLFDLHESSLKPKKDELTTANVDQTVRKSLREELATLVRDGILPNNMSAFKMPQVAMATPKRSYDMVNQPPVVDMKKHLEAAGIVFTPDPKMSDSDSTKKRSRKSHPQRIMMGSDEMNGVDDGANVSSFMSMPGDADPIHTSTPRPESAGSRNEGMMPVSVDDTEIMQYNYVINNKQNPDNKPSPSTTPVMTSTTPNITPVMTPVMTPVTSGLTVAQERLNSDIAAIIQQNMQKPSVKELEAAGVFKIGGFTLVKESDGSLGCPFCNYRTSAQTRLRRHLTLHTGKAYKCNQCDKSYTEESKLKEHIQVKHERSVHFVCEMCKREFTSKGGLKYHNKTMHRKDYSFWCEQCCKGFNQVQFYQTHMDKHNNATPYKCNVCSKEFSYLATLSMHRKTCVALGNAVNKLACEICCDTFENENDLKEHMGSEHCDVLTFRCGCGAEFRWRAAFDQHRLACSTLPREEEQSTAVSEQDDSNSFNIFKVTDVRSLYTSDNQIENIENTKGTSANFDDDDSSDSVEITNVEAGMPIPVKVTEANAEESSDFNLFPIHKCLVCTYTTPKHSHFKRHMMIHTGKKHKCQFCPKSFNELAKLKTHERSKHQGSAKYKCDRCSRTFSSKGGIMYHQQTKHNNSYKYRCEICEKGFNTIQHYVGHKNTHSGIRPHVCPSCGMGFAYPSVLTSHKKVCRGTALSNGDVTSPLFKCSKCNEKFALKTGLDDHMQENHPSESDCKNTYLCECGESFELRALYYLHKESCSESDKLSEIILERVYDDDQDEESEEKMEAEAEGEFQQISPEKFNAIVNQQPVFPS